MAPERQKVDRDKVVKALNAMKAIGIAKHATKPVLKKLLKLYDNKWEHIEADNYQALADAIFDVQEEEPVKKNRNDDDTGSKKKEAVPDDSPEPYRKKLRVRQEGQCSPSSMPSLDMTAGTSLGTPKVEEAFPPQTDDQHGRTESISPQADLKGKRIDAVSTQPLVREKMTSGSPAQVSIREKVAEVTPPQSSLGDEATELAPRPLSRRTDRVGPISQPQTNLRVTRASALAVQTGPAQGKAKSAMAESGSLLIYRRDKRPMHERTGSMTYYKEPKTEPGIEATRGSGTANGYSAPVRPKDEPIDADSPGFEVPIAMIGPPDPIPAANEAQQVRPSQIESSTGKGSTSHAHASESMEPRQTYGASGVEDPPDASSKKATDSEIVNVQDASSSNVEIASSTSGKVKVSLTCSSDQPDFHMPSLETIFKMVEDKCLRTYKILDSGFSLMAIMKEICQSVVELGSESSTDEQENIVNVVPLLDSLKSSSMTSILGGTPSCFSNGTFHLTVPQAAGQMAMSGVCLNQNVHMINENGRNKRKKIRNPKDSNANSQSLVVVQEKQLALSSFKPLHDVNDISKGEERVRISLVNVINNEKYPPSFFYIPQNIVYQNAYVNFSLARIGDEDCCADCFGDCLAVPIPCACARETGGEYAYTLDGLVKKEFLDECISMNHGAPKDRFFYCKDCPLERSKNEVMPDSCKGHLVRKFIKECWSKCGCNKQCSNRVVQRGIACNLQVFYTAEGKGWGLRTLDELPRGAFVCEYVGEVLTNMELYDRTIQTTGKAKHTYPVLLDADWVSEGVLKDEEALCLDATFYGNVARFVNHRCVDANMIEIPVEVETPDHHYYHLAFFTTRKVEAFEELTWDYGIDFDDHDHPIKAFRCRCKSKFCRDLKPTKTRSGR